MADQQSYGGYYYAHCCGRPYERNDLWLSFFGGIADRIVRDIAPRRVLDAGCAMGFLVETLRERGVEAWGIDLSDYAIERVHESVRPYCRVGSVTDPLDERYDLVVCIEVLEHLPAPEAALAIERLSSASDDILFSSTPSDYREPTHVNVRPPEAWAESFAQVAFIRDVDFDASFITPWAMRFRRSQEPLPRIVRAYERQIRPLEMAAREARLYATELQDQLAKLEKELAYAREHVAAVEQSVAWRATHPIDALKRWRRGRRTAAR